MLARLQNHLRRTGHGLCGKAQRSSAWQTHQHTAIGEGFDHRINISRSTAAETRDGIEELFRHLIGGADGSKELRGQLCIGGGSMKTTRKSSRTGSHKRRRVWHGANDADLHRASFRVSRWRCLPRC